MNASPLDGPTSPPPAPWRAGSARATGDRHRQAGVRCQDYAFGAAPPDLPRPLAVVCDGRGSAALSHFGAEAAVRAVRKAVRVLDPLLQQALDQPATSAAAARQWQDLSSVLLRWLMHEQVELAHALHSEVDEYEFTLAAVFGGAHHVGWLQVGDACAAVRHGSGIVLCAPPEIGPYANETRFVRPEETTLQHARRDVMPAAGVTALMAFSDGVSRQLIDGRTGAPAAGLGQIVERLATATWNEERLSLHLRHAGWSEGGDDDRAFAYAVLAEPGSPVAAAGAGETPPPSACEPTRSEAGERVRLSGEPCRRKKRRRAAQASCLTPVASASASGGAPWSRRSA